MLQCQFFLLDSSFCYTDVVKKKAQPIKKEICMNQRPSIDPTSLVLFLSCGGEMPCFIYLLFPTTLLSFFLCLFQLGFVREFRDK